MTKIVKRIRVGAAVGLFSMMGLFVVASPASASDQSVTGSCKSWNTLAGTGYAKVIFHQTTTGNPRTGDIDYQTYASDYLVKAKSVSAHDYAGVYHKDFSTDLPMTYGYWEHMARYYRRGPGTLKVTVRWDMTAVPDMSCTITLFL